MTKTHKHEEKVKRHNHCKHAAMKFCATCDKPYCDDCGQEWNAAVERIVYVNQPIYTSPYVHPIWQTPQPQPPFWLPTCGSGTATSQIPEGSTVFLTSSIGGMQ